MHPAVVPALFTFSTASAMAVYVAARRHKEPLHWLLFAVLAGLAVWTSGVLVRYSVTTVAGLETSIELIFVGILATCSAWLLAAACYARRTVGRRTLVAVLAGSSLLALALFTNEGHRLFVRQLDFETVAAGPGAFVGPLFWVFLAWTYGCVAGGIAYFLGAARSMLRAEARYRGIALAFAALIPLATSTLYVFQPVPQRFDLTPSGLTVSMVLLFLAVFRYQLLESLPLARDTVVEHLEDGVIMATTGGSITGWNPAAERLLEGRVELRIGGSLDGVIGRIRDAGEESGGPFAATLAPEARSLEVTTAVVDEQRGEASSGRFAILCDRSEVLRSEVLARQSQRLEIVAALASGIAHEITDPLTFVRANLVEIERLGARDAEAATSTGAEDDPDAILARKLADLRSIATEAMDGIERIRRIGEEMRGLSANDPQAFAPVELGGVVGEALRLARLDEPGPPEVTVVLERLPRVWGRPERLVQLLANLLVNARQALGDAPDGRIRVEGTVRRGRVELVVTDNGPGIPEDLAPRVFDPFFTTRDPDEGTGLGLAVACDIAREHGGALELGSGSGGACFVLRLPADPAPGTAGPGREVEPEDD